MGYRAGDIYWYILLYRCRRGSYHYPPKSRSLCDFRFSSVSVVSRYFVLHFFQDGNLLLGKSEIRVRIVD
jgi:hypothetical protein